MLTILIVGLYSCKEEDKASTVQSILTGVHPLRKMQQVASSEVSQGSFFIWSASYKQEQEMRICFAWKMNDSTYALSSLPFERFRIRFDSTAIIPTIKFSWNQNYTYTVSDDIADIIKSYVTYAEISVREQDWQPGIVLPMNDTVVNKIAK